MENLQMNFCIDKSAIKFLDDLRETLSRLEKVTAPTSAMITKSGSPENKMNGATHENKVEAPAKRRGRPPKAKPQAQAQSEPVVESDTDSEDDGMGLGPTASKETKKLTLSDIKKALLEYKNENGADAARAILSQFKVTNVINLQEKDYPKVIAATQN